MNMISILFTWFAWICIFVGIGFLTLDVLRLRVATSINRVFVAFWVGWSSCVGLLQIWHMFRRVDISVWPVIAAISLAGWVLFISHNRVLSARISKVKSLLALFVVIITGVWIASICTSAKLPMDSGLYHLQSVLWIKSYAIIPGLGNLHARLAFNNSNFLYSALLDQWVWDGKAYYLANGLLMYVFILQSIWRVVSLLRARLSSTPDYFAVLFIGPALGWIYGTPSMYQISGYSPDILIFIFGAVVSILVLDLLFSKGTRHEDLYTLTAIAIIASAGTTVKISFVVFALSAICYAQFLYARRYGWRIFQLFQVYSIPIILIGTWMVRGFTLSGYLAFPYPNLSVPVDWKVPYDIASRTSNGIYEWGRSLGKSIPTDGAMWIKIWVWHFDKNISLAAITATISLLASIGLHCFSKNKIKIAFLIPLFIPVFSLLFWFFSSPLPRFSGAGFWALAGIAIIHLFEQIRGLLKNWQQQAIIWCFVGLFIISNWWAIQSPVLPLIRTDLGKPDKDMNRSTENFRTFVRDGVDIHYPEKDDNLCWITPLPCALKETERLHLRTPGVLQDGFINK